MAKSNLALLRPNVTFYGISLSDSALRNWEGDNAENPKLVINWNQIDARADESLNNISIAIAQRFPTYSKENIKSLAHDIYNGNKIKVNDSVIGVVKNNIEKIGYISAKNTSDERQIELSVNWVEKFDVNDFKTKLVSSDAQFSVISSKKLKQIERKFQDVVTRAYNLMPELESDYKSYNEIAEAATKFDDTDFMIDTPKEDKGGIITIFYGTNRNIITEKGKEPDFGSEETDEINYGSCDVQLPEGHKRGELERPGNILWWQLPTNEHVHVVMKSCKLMSSNDFKASFAETLLTKPKKQGLLFIHGYQTTFKEAAYRTAQLAWDLPFTGYAGFFSWPSSGELLPYPTDGAAARSTAPLLKTFIGELLQVNGLEQLHIIAHSMGGLVLTLALKDLAADSLMMAHLNKIFQLILGAPDIDKKEFKNVILPSFNKLGKRRTLYASNHDTALNVSSIGRSNRERLGQIIEDVFTSPGLDSIEASNLKAKSNHSYIFQNSEVLSDLFFLITQGLAPADRRLREIEKAPLNYWLFPK